MAKRTVDQAIDILFNSGEDVSGDSDDDPSYKAVISDEFNCSSNSSDSDVGVVEKSAVGSLIPQDITTSSGFTWKVLTRSRVGRSKQAAVFKDTPGITQTVRNIASESPYMAWKLFINESMLRKLLSCTIAEGQTYNSQWSLTMDKLETFIDLDYARGIHGRNHSVEYIWSKQYGPSIFKETMFRENYKEIQRYLRFDYKSTRSSRIINDKFTHVRRVFESFAETCMKMYTPNFSLTIDEQLLPMKNRCPFIVYMPNKPIKFGVKFLVLVDIKSNCVLNIRPYLGAHEKESRNGLPQGESVVLKLMEPIKQKGYNVTKDNFFTSVQAAKNLQDQGTSIVGTIQANSKHLCKEMSVPRKGGKYSSKFYYEEDGGCLFVSYQSKEKKSVCFFSTMHVDPAVYAGTKKKPNVVLFDSKNKVGVDVVDQMVRQHSTRCATKRWPLGIWSNILDLVALNAWILYKKSTSSKVSRKKFILQLVEELRSCYVQSSQMRHPHEEAEEIENTPSATKNAKDVKEISATMPLSPFAELARCQHAANVLWITQSY